MKKFEFGLFALCVLVGGQIGSMFGIAVAICAFMTISGAVEEISKRKSKKDKNDKEEAK
jgi:hypothetical protein